MKFDNLEAFMKDLLIEKEISFIHTNSKKESFDIQISCSNKIENEYNIISSFPELKDVIEDLIASVEDFKSFCVCLFIVGEKMVTLHHLDVQIQKRGNRIDLTSNSRIKSFVEYFS